jgi:hypothetical protein
MYPMRRIQLIRRLHRVLPIPGLMIVNDPDNIVLIMPNPHRIAHNTRATTPARNIRNHKLNTRAPATAKPAATPTRPAAVYALRTALRAIAAKVGGDNSERIDLIKMASS